MARSFRPIGTYSLKCAGTSYRREALTLIAGNAPGQEALAFCIAKLAPENGNQHDPNAVAIWIDGHHVAYLPRDYTAAYRAMLQSATGGLPAVTARAVISKGLVTADRRYDYVVELDAAINASLLVEGEPPCGGTIRITPQRPLGRLIGRHDWMVWLDEYAVVDVRPGAKVEPWSADHWESVGYFVANRQRAGLGHRMFSIPKSPHAVPLIGTVKRVEGRFAILSMEPSPD